MATDFVRVSEQLNKLLDADTVVHSSRVSTLTAILLKSWLELYPEGDIDDHNAKIIEEAAFFHDIGKAAISKKVLLKPERLSDEEFEVMKAHTIKGYEYIGKIQFDDTEFREYCLEICRSHHERYDGKGYPDGLCGDDIPVWVNLVAFADCFDALVFPRKYKYAIDCEKASRMILDGKCGAFSDEVLNCFDNVKAEIFEFVEQNNVGGSCNVC